ncbi:hypothetical protein [Streptomyces formicae]|uniref:Uncharacterized protein n=1 Tax=Streptomyces formicae TaxID=1616117 RepID=A0ABY3WMC3_9ACTN|nr:hypothetical protein [Streptomyces formicae]UNM13798.1 hypothetical protein J4032_22145 [Streptomyces formicae]
MTTAVDPESWPCAVCDRPARERVHRGCEDRMRTNLEALPRLYRALAAALQPGRRGGDGRSGTRTAPIPCSLDAVDLRARGGIEGVLGGWARDLCEREGWSIPDYTSITAIVDWGAKTLITNLPMICDEHPAVKEIADELRSVRAQAERLITGEKPPRRVPVACPCGAILRVTLDTAGVKCPGCSQQYGHSELFGLPLAERRAAA